MKTVLSKPHKWLLVLPVGITIIISFALLKGQQAGQNSVLASVGKAEAAPLNAAVLPYSCRYGISTSHPDQPVLTPDLSAGWLIHYGGFIAAPNILTDNIRLVSVRQEKSGNTYLDSYVSYPPMDQLDKKVKANLGQLWMVGNEVDRAPNPDGTGGQGSTYPDVYARAYHDIYTRIKALDPTAQVANSPLVEVTPGRLQYLDMVWEEYLDQFGTTMPVDVWNIHIYVLPEANSQGIPNTIANVALGTDPALAIRDAGEDPSKCPLENVYCRAEHDSVEEFGKQVIAMRQWMYDHGQRNKPLILSEYSILYPNGTLDEEGNAFTYNRVQEFLVASANWMDSATDSTLGYPLDGNRLIQQWNWFSVWAGGAGSISNLADYIDSFVINTTGDVFVSQAELDDLYVNLVPVSVGAAAVPVNPEDGMADVSLSVSIINNGNIPPETTFDVSFYSDSGLTQLITTVQVLPAPEPPILFGCARRYKIIQGIWPDLPVGEYDYWVMIDSGNDIPENVPSGGGENDNVISGSVQVTSSGTYLPAIVRSN